MNIDEGTRDTGHLVEYVFLALPAALEHAITVIGRVPKRSDMLPEIGATIPKPIGTIAIKKPTWRGS